MQIITTRLRRAFSITLETTIEANLYRRKSEFAQLATTSTPLSGHYSLSGSQTFLQKHPSIHTKQLNHEKIRISSIGMGTYKGSCDESDDLPMFNGLVDSALLGCNVIDSCRNFRKGRSEKVVGWALQHLCSKQGFSRDSFLVCSKAGYVFQELPSGVPSSEVVNDHCVHPLFLQNQLQQSLSSLGLKTIDVYYLNNFPESQLQALGKKQFETKLSKAFEVLEKARQDGKIRNYGLSCWQAFRVGEHHPVHISLQNILKIAEKVGGSSHGLKFIQLPINIMMPEAFADKYAEDRSLLGMAEELHINVISNSPMLSGTLVNIPMPASLLKCNNNGAKHLQLMRSIPSSALVCTLVGHKLNRHVRKNLQVLEVNGLDQSEWLQVFVPKSEPAPISA